MQCHLKGQLAVEQRVIDFEGIMNAGQLAWRKLDVYGGAGDLNYFSLAHVVCSCGIFWLKPANLK